MEMTMIIDKAVAVKPSTPSETIRFWSFVVN